MEDTSASAPEAVEAVEAATVDTAEATGEATETVEQAEAVETPKRPSWSDELAKTRKEMLREREALQRGAAKIAAPEELGEFDPFNEASVQARIEAEVARRLQDVLQPMQQEYELMAAEEAYQGFLQAHPDFESDVELRAEVQQALESSPSLDLETAYYAVQGRRARHQAAETQQRSAAERKARREAAARGTGMPRKGGAPVRPNGRDLKKMSSADILALAKQLAAGR